MEKHEFMPWPAPHVEARSTPPMEAGTRDLPPGDRAPSMPSPRMERPSQQGGGCPVTDCHGDGNHNDHNGGGCGCVGHEGCGPDSWGLTGYPVAMVFAPCQSYHALYDSATALNRGTLFTELDLPLGEDCGGFSTIGCACRAERRGL